MRILICSMIGALAVVSMSATTSVSAADKVKVDPAAVEAAIKAGWPNSDADWKKRLVQDETEKVCSVTRNHPDKDLAAQISAAAKESVKYPEDGKLMGDWKEGEKLAQSGYGMRFSDYPPKRENGGNCYACHQLDKAEVSYGTIGPSLTHYGKLRDFKPEAVKAAYEKIYNAHIVFPCSNMPRFGANGVLTIDQIKHIVALLMDKELPVNK